MSKRHIALFSRLLAVMLILAVAPACAAHGEAGVFSPRKEYEYLVGSTVWQLSAESKALMRQSFSLAKGMIAQMVSKCLIDGETQWHLATDESGAKRMFYGDRRVAVICDIDDTLVDGARYTANIIGSDGDYNNVAFARFVLSEACEALPGAVDFTNACVENGVEVYYITNRYDQGYKIGQSDSMGAYPEAGGGLYFGLDGKEIGTTLYQTLGMSFYDITLTRMRELGFPIDEEHLILHDGKVVGGTKEPARAAVRNGASAFPNGRRADGCANCALTVDIDAHYVAMLLGDQLSDFTDDFDREGLDAISRAELTSRYQDKWGSEWIMLPNAVYGKAFDYALSYGIPELLRAADYTRAEDSAS